MKPSEVFHARVRRIARPLRRFGRPILDLWPLTALGMAVAVVAAVALVRFGFAKLDLVLLVLGYGGVALLSLCVLAVAGAAVGVRASLGRAPAPPAIPRLETGTSLPTGFSMPSLWWFPLVQVRWRWESPERAEVAPVHAAGRLSERVLLGRRGVFPNVVRRVVVQDAFGLARVAFRREQDGPLEVLPHLGGIRRLPVLTSLVGGDEVPHPMGLEDGDRVELRRYVPGDSARFIHWKVFGRTRKLMVRVPERALSRARRTVAYLVAGPSDEASAAAARAAIEEGALGTEWQFGADGTADATSDRREALHKVMASSSHRGPSGAGIRRFLEQVDAQGPAALVVFAPPERGPWLDEIRALSARRYGRIRVVIAVDAVDELRVRPTWRRWLFRPDPRVGASRVELEHVGRALSQLRCEVVMIDRVSGRMLGDGVRTTLPAKRAA